MEKEKKPKRDFEAYSWAPVMQRIYSSEDTSRYLRGALEGNAVKQGSNGKGLEAIIEGAMANKQSKEMAIAYTQEEYESEMRGITIGEYFSHYNDILEKYFGKEAPSVEEHSGMKLNDFNKKMRDLQYRLSNPDEDEAKKALEEIRKYESLSLIMNIIQDEHYRTFLPEAIEKTNKYLAKKVIMHNKREQINQ